MGNKTYTSGEINIDPALTKEHADKIEAKMRDAFGAWPQWKIVKPEWDHAHLAVIGEELIGTEITGLARSRFNFCANTSVK